MRYKRIKKTFRFESLENRRMLDGNITTSFANNNLTIKGDVAANSLMITNSSDGVVELLGLNTTDPVTHISTPTTINGHASQLFLSIKGIFVDFTGGVSGVNRGNDVLVVTGLTLTGGMSIQAGDGNNIFAFGQFDNSGNLVDTAVNSSLGQVTLGNGLLISMGSGADTFVANQVTLNGKPGPNLTITAGDGSSTLTLQNVAVSHNVKFTDTGSLTVNADQFTAKNLTIVTGVGNDSITITNSTITLKTSINVSYGNDTISLDHFNSGSLSATLGPGADHLTATTVSITNAATIQAGISIDTVALTGFSAGSLNVSMGAGDDSLTLTSVTVTKTATVDGGAGNDSLDLETVTAKTLKVTLGAGIDQLTLDGGSATKANLDGGDGGDTLNLTGFSATTLKATLDNGNDTVTLQNVAVTGVATFGGGAGADTYTDSGGNTFGTRILKKFETE